MGRFDGLGRALRLARAEQGKRQVEIAEAAQTSKSMLSKYETGRQVPTLETLDRLLDALGLSLAELERRLNAQRDRGGETLGPQPAPPASSATPRPPAVEPELPALFGLPAGRRAAADAALFDLFRALRELVDSLR